MEINKNISIDAVTDKILHIYSKGAVQAESFAVEAGLPVEGTLQKITAEGEDGGIYATKSLEIRMHSDGAMDIYDRDGRLLCAEYTGERAVQQDLTEEEREHMRQEGHAIYDDVGNCSFQVCKCLTGDEVIYGLGDKTGFLNKKGYDYIDRKSVV